ncbi:MAG: hypothetical protein ACPGXI_06245 [Mycobacterium sp.]
MTLTLAWGAIAVITGVAGYRWRHRTLRLCLLVVGAALALTLAVVLTGEYAPDLFFSATKIFIATVLLSILSVLLVARSLPQLVSKHDRHSVAIVFSVIVVMYLAVGAFLAAAADNQLRVTTLPEVRTRDEFLEWRDSPVDPGEMLLEARISAAMPELEAPQHHGTTAWYRCPEIGPIRLPAFGGLLPSRYLLDLPGGPPVVASGIESGNQAWAWPSASDGSAGCALRRGDPVVVWGNLTPGMGTGGGPTSYTGLADVRKIAVGDIRSFLDGYVPVAEHTGRAVLGLATLNGLLAAVMAGIGLMTFRRLARTGDATPPKITWRSGPR